MGLTAHAVRHVVRDPVETSEDSPAHPMNLRDNRRKAEVGTERAQIIIPFEETFPKVGETLDPQCPISEAAFAALTNEELQLWVG